MLLPGFTFLKAYNFYCFLYEFIPTKKSCPIHLAKTLLLFYHLSLVLLSKFMLPFPNPTLFLKLSLVEYVKVVSFLKQIVASKFILTNESSAVEVLISQLAF